MNLEQLNQLSADDAATAFANCCVASRWIEGMVAARPFVSLEQLYQLADSIWQDLEEADYLEAFEGHPKIGDVTSLKQKYASTKALAAGEQSSVNDATDEVIQALATGNSDYENRYGFIFIVCATGKSAAEMLALLQARLGNERSVEVQNAADEQAKITRIRINKLLDIAA
ncbi:2-oxo-4-hydroxy-4-carboxy-5-ureidoimidazoline decarboxylase [Oceanobacter mangrovi]|uniref:2-oxo-4-hydroxy-4-carboxy-5-ureidoimidazoline decarboxylase n=1 Tax=Oceanobacter mangrovi TaxID=2862510 RepID=UPI001C8E01CC|nr:2-oxo-4-hydroxy-4-carboxy-5-ureidoimidazoline decarboxylase [Oceanobacter mangrovi]